MHNLLEVFGRLWFFPTTIPVKHFYYFIHLEVPKLHGIFDSVRACDKFAVSSCVYSFSADMSSIHLVSRTIFPKIIDAQRVVPTSRVKNIRIPRVKFDTEYPV